ncbi:MAG: hypothetical protein BWY67_02269 [Bacteroidetes bacterium ADurb.Bin397]|jgi:hypothetical protein|nr:MAG: hypothetical protein BWY67_02269 [Bacteroidetes bacterium ADurb.Bin397]
MKSQDKLLINQPKTGGKIQKNNSRLTEDKLW